MHRINIAFVIGVLVPSLAWSADWNQFRGPSTNGIADAQEPPPKWNAENIRWKMPLPQPGNGSPIVSGDRVFVACAQDAEGMQRSLYCFDRQTGQLRWIRSIEFDQPSPTHATNPYCGSTPAADGQRVVVWHASAGLYCYDFDGNEIWSRNLGQFEHMWGYGGSPILHEGRVLLNCSPSKVRTFVTALDLATGETLWETEEPLVGNGEETAEGRYIGSWTSPVLVEVDGKVQIICAHPTRLVGYDPQSGKILWWCEGMRGGGGDLAYSSPLSNGEFCFVIAGYQGPGFTVRLGRSGNITQQRLWHKQKNPQSIGSGILRDDVVYVPNAEPGTLQCINWKTGEVLWTARSGAGIWGSIVAAGDTMYVTNQEGETIVFRHNPREFERIAVNPLNEPSNSTPAIAGNEIFIRTMKHVYCIAP